MNYQKTGATLWDRVRQAVTDIIHAILSSGQPPIP